MDETGPIFVLIKVFRNEEMSSFPERRMAEGWAEVRETLLAEIGLVVGDVTRHKAGRATTRKGNHKGCPSITKKVRSRGRPCACLFPCWKVALWIPNPRRAAPVFAGPR